MIEVIQVTPRSDYKVYVYFSNGNIRLYDMNDTIKNGGIFNQISDIHSFIDKCTVMNGTLAWDISGAFDPAACIDIDPETIYNSGDKILLDPLENSEAS